MSTAINTPHTLEAWVDGIGLLGPGLENWTAAQTILAGEHAYVAQPLVVPPPVVPPPVIVAIVWLKPSRLNKAPETLAVATAAVAGRTFAAPSFNTPALMVVNPV